MTTIVVAGILKREGLLLACQRRLTDRFPGKWEFPGGKVEQGEEPRAANWKKSWASSPKSAS